MKTIDHDDVTERLKIVRDKLSLDVIEELKALGHGAVYDLDWSCGAHINGQKCCLDILAGDDS